MVENDIRFINTVDILILAYDITDYESFEYI